VIALREIAADRVRFDKNLTEIMGSTPAELREKYGEPKREKTETQAAPSGTPRFF